jgi:hypothetical protein
MLKNVSKGDNMKYLPIYNIWTVYELDLISFERALELIRLLEVE